MITSEARDKLMRKIWDNEKDSKLQLTLDQAAQSLNKASEICHYLAKDAGWWDKDRNDGEMIALMHSELSEALEGLRKNSHDDHLPHRKSVEVELVDCLVRIFDFAGARNLDLSGAFMEKLAFNQERQDHKRENRAKEGGKSF